MTSTRGSSVIGDPDDPATIGQLTRRMSSTRALLRTVTERLCTVEQQHSDSAAKVSMLERSLTFLQSQISDLQALPPHVAPLSDNDSGSTTSADSLLDVADKLQGMIVGDNNAGGDQLPEGAGNAAGAPKVVDRALEAELHKTAAGLQDDETLEQQYGGDIG